jgi:hypothetical protein
MTPAFGFPKGSDHLFSFALGGQELPISGTIPVLPYTVASGWPLNTLHAFSSLGASLRGCPIVTSFTVSK